MSIARLADRLLEHIVPTAQAGACEHSECYCAVKGGLCRYVFTNCAGTKCNVYGNRCPKC